MSETKDPQELETILTRLEAIAEQLEAGETNLETSLALFEEGVRLSKLGTRRLDDAERKLEILLEGDARAPLNLGSATTATADADS